jgi:hypothetical protein
LGLRCSRKYRQLVCFQNLKPVVYVLGVILTRFSAQPEMRASERRAQFGNQFFGGIGVIAKSLP